MITMNAQEQAFADIYWETYQEERKNNPDAVEPPEDIRLTLKRWLSTLEDFVSEHPGAKTKPVDNPSWRTLGMIAYTDDRQIITVHIPISSLWQENDCPDFMITPQGRGTLAQNITMGDRPSERI